MSLLSNSLTFANTGFKMVLMLSNPTKNRTADNGVASNDLLNVLSVNDCTSSWYKITGIFLLSCRVSSSSSCSIPSPPKLCLLISIAFFLPFKVFNDNGYVSAFDAGTGLMFKLLIK